MSSYKFAGFEYSRVGDVARLTFRGKAIWERAGSSWELSIGRLSVIWLPASKNV